MWKSWASIVLLEAIEYASLGNNKKYSGLTLHGSS